MAHKGSKKHVLDLINSEDFIQSLNVILQPYNASITDRKTVQPKGKDDESEYGLQSFINNNNLIELFPSLKNINSNFIDWWNPHGGKSSTWDMISLCQLDGKDAVLLVEAKAHKSEFTKAGKAKLKEGASIKAENNLINIEKRIKEACDNLNNKKPGFNISIDSHYQLSNRVAFAWQLKQLNIPVVLLYLGFIGDSDFNDKFKNEYDWKEVFTKYIKGIVPVDFINENKSDFLFIQSSLSVK